MSDFLVALGLVMVLEGLIYGGFPAFAKRLAEQVREMGEAQLRVSGLFAMAVGVLIVWIARG